MRALRWVGFTAAAAVCAGLLAAPFAAAGELAIGGSIPKQSVKMKNVDGKELTLAGAAGKKGTLVVFTCNGCPWVVAWQGRLVELGNKFQKEGVSVVFVNSNDPGQSKDGIDGYAGMQARAKDLGMTFPYVVDATSEVATAFGATRTPEAFLFDAKGKLVYHGTVDDNAQEPSKVTATYLADALQELSAGKPVTVAETKALGCTIKFRGAAKEEKPKSS